MHDFQFHTVERTLTDGSQVVDVRMSVNDGEHWHTLDAISKGDAWQLVNKLADAINEHTNMEARIV